MQKIWSWTKENAGALAAIGGILAALAGITQFAVLSPIHQRFDAQDQRLDAQSKRLDDLKADMGQRFDAQDKYMNQRFDAVDQRLDRLENDVSELRKLSERVSRNEGQIQVIRQQLQTADAPAP